jgi:hypothetical protein
VCEIAHTGLGASSHIKPTDMLLEALSLENGSGIIVCMMRRRALCMSVLSSCVSMMRAVRLVRFK